MAKQTLTAEQLNTLYAYAKANGRTWKAKLNDAWVAGGYDATTGNYIDASLQQIRNTFGPSWLANFRLAR